MATDLLSTISAEIDARLRELHPLLAEYERLLVAAQALDLEAESELTEVASPLPVARRRKARTRAKSPSRHGETDETILGILEHGSHTVAELVVVTAMSTANINSSLRRLLSRDAIAKTEREGKIAYVLS